MEFNYFTDGDTWTMLEQVVELFKPTIDALSRLEGESYITQSLILMEMCLLEDSVKNMKKKYPAINNPRFHKVIVDLEEELATYWDKNLPIDTVIATLLDPRTKFFQRIPPNEIKEAVKLLKIEYNGLADSGEVEDDARRKTILLRIY